MNLLGPNITFQKQLIDTVFGKTELRHEHIYRRIRRTN